MRFSRALHLDQLLIQEAPVARTWIQRPPNLNPNPSKTTKQTKSGLQIPRHQTLHPAAFKTNHSPLRTHPLTTPINPDPPPQTYPKNPQHPPQQTPQLHPSPSPPPNQDLHPSPNQLHKSQSPLPPQHPTTPTSAWTFSPTARSS